MDITQHVGLVRSIVTRLGVARSNRDDAFQEGMIALMAAVPAFDPTRAAWSTFATRCVTNAVRNFTRTERRANARTRRLMDATTPSMLEASPVDPASDMGRALAALDPRTREVITLRVVEGWTLEAVAAHVGLGKSRVAVLEREGLEKMRGLV